MYNKITLNNGVRIVYEKIPYVKSVSIGIWVGTGSRREDIHHNGISHFIEHMLFKGTKNRTAKQIAECIDNIGGQINAFTGKECTCYYTKTLDTHIDIAIDVLTDMLFNSNFDKKDIDVERKVILEEIKMYEDSPEELVHDLLSETSWKGNPLGYPILGNEQSLFAIDKNAFKNYIKNCYTPQNTVVSVAGNFDEKALVEIISQKFHHWKCEPKKESDTDIPEFKNNIEVKEKDTEQIHICLGFNGIPHGNDELYALLTLNNIFGGGMSSRLFQKIREEQGLVYSIYSYPSSYKNAGIYAIYAGMNPEHLKKVTELVWSEIQNFIKSGINHEELSKSKEQLKGNYILGLESTSSRMNSIGKSELMLGRINTPEEILKKIDNVNMDNINNIIKKVFSIDNFSFSAVGNLKGCGDVLDFSRV